MYRYFIWINRIHPYWKKKNPIATPLNKNALAVRCVCVCTDLIRLCRNSSHGLRLSLSLTLDRIKKKKKDFFFPSVQNASESLLDTARLTIEWRVLFDISAGQGAVRATNTYANQPMSSPSGVTYSVPLRMFRSLWH